MAPEVTTLRIATTDAFGAHVMDALEPVRRQFPETTLSLLTGNATVDLKAREAEIAVRMFRNDDDALASLKLGQLGWSVYATEHYLTSRTSAGLGLLTGHRIIGYVDSLKAMAGAAWISANAAPEAIRMQCAGPTAALKIALTHFGVCVIPCYMAKDQPLVRLTADVVATTDVYAMFVAERRSEPVIGAAIDALFEMFDRESALMSGDVKN